MVVYPLSENTPSRSMSVFEVMMRYNNGLVPELAGPRVYVYDFDVSKTTHPRGATPPRGTHNSVPLDHNY